MRSIFHNPRAFAPFYDEVVAVEAKRARSGGARVLRCTVRACVLDQGLDEPLAEGSTGTLRRRWTIRVRAADWPYTTPPQIGDVARIPGEFEQGGDPVRAAVLSIARHEDDWLMEARQC